MLVPHGGKCHLRLLKFPCVPRMLGKEATGEMTFQPVNSPEHQGGPWSVQNLDGGNGRSWSPSCALAS